ncbi:MAG: OadG family transporter subunit [Atribacterota bacterium]|nr:OadG family transporter subunit [Atribacterota bacterium]MDD5638129.1 OadG family transporter subunit [Atribacterota bacterium]
MYEGIEGAIILSLIALVMVFIILGLLALLMVGLRKIVEFSAMKVAKEKKVITTDQKYIKKEEKLIIPPDEKKTIVSEQRENEEIIAIISAALANFQHMTVRTQPINAISIKRIMSQTLNPWSISGRQNMMTERISISARKKGGF